MAVEFNNAGAEVDSADGQTYLGVSRDWGKPASMLVLGASGGKDWKALSVAPLDHNGDVLLPLPLLLCPEAGEQMSESNR